MSNIPSRPVSRRAALGGAALIAIAGSQLLASAKIAYDRQKAATYARGRVYDDPSQIQFENGCAWYVSRVLWVGGGWIDD